MKIYIVNPKSKTDTEKNQFLRRENVDHRQLFNNLWKEWHCKKDPSLSWIKDWLSRIPKFCSCQFSFEEWIRDNPPEYENWFEYSVRGHNFVNRKLDRVEYGVLDAEAITSGDDTEKLVQLIRPKILSPIPTPTKSRAVLVLVPDEKSRAEFKYTENRMRLYAENCEADFVVISKISKQTHKCGNKYAYSQIAHLWEQTLWLDTDVIVNPIAPNIFDSVPPGSWGLVDDLAVMENTDWFVSEFRLCQRYWGVEETRIPACWNSGVVVAPRNAIECYYPPPMRVPNVWCAEQHWHTQALMLNNANVVTLPETWNNGFPWKQWYRNLSTSYCNHVNGCHPAELRVEVIAELASGNTKLSDEVLGKIMNSWRPGWLE